MATFTFIFPFSILLVLCKNRKKLWTPKVMDAYGFLYARFVVGAELWDLHELLRKLLLTAVLLVLQSNTRNAAAILICTLANCTLNFYQPHRNRLVLRVAQLSFLLATLKYLCAMLISVFSTDETAVGGNDEVNQDIENIGFMLVVMDLLFVASSIGTTVVVVVLLKRKLKNAAVQAAETANMEASMDDVPPATKVVGVQGGTNESVEAAPRRRRMMPRGVLHSGTIKGSLRYNAKVALHLKKGKVASAAHDETSAALKKKIDSRRLASRLRLNGRLRSRKRQQARPGASGVLPAEKTLSPMQPQPELEFAL
jgi:hypothetical protein